MAIYQIRIRTTCSVSHIRLDAKVGRWVVGRSIWRATVHDPGAKIGEFHVDWANVTFRKSGLDNQIVELTLFARSKSDYLIGEILHGSPGWTEIKTPVHTYYHPGSATTIGPVEFKIPLKKRKLDEILEDSERELGDWFADDVSD